MVHMGTERGFYLFTTEGHRYCIPFHAASIEPNDVKAKSISRVVSSRLARLDPARR